VRGRPTRLRVGKRTARFTRNRVRLLHNGDEYFPAMLEAIRGAEREILLEMYWFGSDRTGRRFAEALCERAKAGVCVRVTYDAVGSIEASTSMFDEMLRAGVEVHEFNPIAPWRVRFSFGRINQRDHRKLLVVDARIGIAGGLNLGDPWAPKHEGGDGFRDDAIEVVGSAAQELRALFYRTFPKRPSVVFPPEALDGETAVSVLANDHWEERRDIYDGYLNAIARATREIIITNSYFIPAARVRRALARAVQRGVRVRVLVPRDSDVRLTQLASRHLYERLLEDGIEIYEWRGGILHSKTALVDDSWCTVGSFNFDARSIHNNLELNIAVRDPVVNRALRTRVELDLKDAIRVDLNSFRRRGLLTRTLESFVYLFRWLL
jgi:cardiolipin synthase